MKDVFIVAAKRTPTGSFLGSLSGHTAPELGAHAIKSLFSAKGAEPQIVQSVYMGNVLSAGLGQSPARQAARMAQISDSTDATTINKVCSSGMKAVMLAAQQIQLGLEDVAVGGGMESMSNVPHYACLRGQIKAGDLNLVDGLFKDALHDAYDGFHMGNAAELAAIKYDISREEQDEYAVNSYKKAADAFKKGKLSAEISPLELKSGKALIRFETDEDVYKLIPEKVSLLKPSFDAAGTITAANASNLNDGAAALLLASESALNKYKLSPLARIVTYADAAQSPEWFSTSPSLAIQKVLKQANLRKEEIDFYEINEAYSAVALANIRILGLDTSRVNVYGGAVASGHPLGASGARIICTLLSVLRNEGARYGIAAICNGGGGASAILIENIKS